MKTKIFAKNECNFSKDQERIFWKNSFQIIYQILQFSSIPGILINLCLHVHWLCWFCKALFVKCNMMFHNVCSYLHPSSHVFLRIYFVNVYESLQTFVTYSILFFFKKKYNAKWFIFILISYIFNSCNCLKIEKKIMKRNTQQLITILYIYN